MTPQTNETDVRVRLFMRLAFTVGLLLFGYSLVYSLYILQTTGGLTVTTTGRGAVVTISQTGHQAQYLGSGTVKVRLPPGTYTVMAKNDGKTYSSVVTMSKKKTQTIALNKQDAALIPSINSVSFNGFDALTSNGLTATQVTNLKQLLFSYKQTANTFTITASSITPGPHDPNSDAPFSLTFSGTIDNEPYKAVVTYTGFDDITLTLQDSTGATVFSGNMPSANPNQGD